MNGRKDIVNCRTNASFICHLYLSVINEPLYWEQLDVCYQLHGQAQRDNSLRILDVQEVVIKVNVCLLLSIAYSAAIIYVSITIGTRIVLLVLPLVYYMVITYQLHTIYYNRVMNNLEQTSVNILPPTHYLWLRNWDNL